LITDLNLWNRQRRLDKTFSSSGAFILPNGAERSPDASWVESSRWEALTAEERKKFIPLAPDFVIELRSETDSLKKLQQRRIDWEETSQLCATRQKMAEYRDNAVRLGWLIDPQQQRSYELEISSI
jgi:Uma2 family endonuclease